jgi:hypothetical protein
MVDEQRSSARSLIRLASVDFPLQGWPVSIRHGMVYISMNDGTIKDGVGGRGVPSCHHAIICMVKNILVYLLVLWLALRTYNGHASPKRSPLNVKKRYI